MNILGVAAAAAALTLIVIGALQVVEVTTLDGADMLAVLFILLGVITLVGVFPAGHRPWPHREREP